MGFKFLKLLLVGILPLPTEIKDLSAYKLYTSPSEQRLRGLYGNDHITTSTVTGTDMFTDGVVNDE